MKILFVTTKLNGGAFRVLETLRTELEGRGHITSLFYGYGSRGRRDARDNSFNAKRLTSFPIAISNFVSHKFFGIDLFKPTYFFRRRFRNALKSADLVHLHVIHSYGWRYSWLLKEIVKQKKPVLWTLHDAWLITGRCAQPGNCTRWKTSCYPCPSKSAYPPSKLDLTKIEYGRKRQILKSFLETTNVHFVSCANWLAVEIQQHASFEVATIHNAVDPVFFDRKAKIEQTFKSDFLFVSRYLDHRMKGDVETLIKICQKLGSNLTLIGDSPLQEILNTKVNIIPFSENKHAIKNVYLNHNKLIFLSEIDFFSLVAIEALVCDMQIIGIKSPNLIELEKFGGVHIFSNKHELLNALDMELVPSKFEKLKFTSEYMTNEYISHYLKLIQT